MSNPSNHNKVLVTTAVENAEIILAYCAECGIEVKEESVRIIVEMRSRISKTESLDDLEPRFWTIYASLAQKIQPVTIDSLKATTPKNLNGKNGFRKFFTSKTIAHESADSYRVLGLVFMIFMLLVQIYWVIGAKLVSDINTLLPQQIEEILNEKTEKEITLGDKAATSIEIARMEGKLLELGNKLTASSIAIKKWNNIWEKVIMMNKETITDDLEIPEDYLEIKYATFALDAMQEYLLPLLYGLLGAFAFVYRDIFLEIKNRTFTREARIKYILRLHLGALTGLAVGWFFGNDGSKMSFTFSSLSPLALSFLAGYAVEILFSGMDRLISSFSDEKLASLMKKNSSPKSPPELPLKEVSDHK